MSSWTSALGVVESLAPTIASCIGGPLAGGAVSALERVFGLTPAPAATTDDRTSAVAAAIEGATPEQLAAMRKADQDYDLALKEAGFKDIETLAALKVQDVSSARNMEVSTKSIMPPLLGGLIVIASLIIAGVIVAGKVTFATTAEATMAGTVIGYVFSEAKAVLAFYFGSTSDTEQVNNLLAKSTPPSN